MKKPLFLIVLLVFVIGIAFAETGVKKEDRCHTNTARLS